MYIFVYQCFIGQYVLVSVILTCSSTIIIIYLYVYYVLHGCRSAYMHCTYGYTIYCIQHCYFNPFHLQKAIRNYVHPLTQNIQDSSNDCGMRQLQLVHFFPVSFPFLWRSRFPISPGNVRVLVMLHLHGRWYRVVRTVG